MVSSGVQDSGATPRTDSGGLALSGAYTFAGLAGAIIVNSYGGVACRLGRSIVFLAYVTGLPSSLARSRKDASCTCCGTTRATHLPATGFVAYTSMSNWLWAVFAALLRSVPVGSIRSSSNWLLRSGVSIATRNIDPPGLTVMG